MDSVSKNKSFLNGRILKGTKEEYNSRVKILVNEHVASFLNINSYLNTFKIKFCFVLFKDFRLLKIGWQKCYFKKLICIKKSSF